MEVIDTIDFTVECPCCGSTLQLNSKDIRPNACAQAFGYRGIVNCPVCKDMIVITKDFKPL